MLRKTFLGLLLAPLLVLAAGCCANNPCDCNDLLADSLYFAFDSSFRVNELDTVFVARYNLDTKQRIDILPLTRPARRPRPRAFVDRLADLKLDTLGIFLLSNNAPFAPTTTGANISRYYYKLLIRSDQDTSFYRYQLTGIRLQGSYQADGCCTCYRNSQKQVIISQGNARTGADPVPSTRPINVTDSGYGLAAVPVVITLTK